MQEQSFSHGVLQTHGWDWIRFDQNGKHFTSKALVVALKKTNTQDLLPFFQTLSFGSFKFRYEI